jgi:hypothetical protein
MKITLLVTGVAAMALAAGAASAVTKHHIGASAGGTYAAPAQPVAYDKLNAYLKATPKQRASRDWSDGSQTAAATAAGVNTSASAPVANAPVSPDAQPVGPGASSGDTNAVPPLQTPGNQTAAPADSGNGMNPTGPAGMPAQPQP